MSAKCIVRFCTFSASTLVGTAVDTGVLWVCSHLWLETYAGRTLLAPTLSFLAATVANFLVAYFLVWGDRMRRSGGAGRMLRLYGMYFGNCVVGFLVKMCFLQLLTAFTPLDVVYANLIALCFSGVYNFLMNDKLIFKKRPMEVEKCKKMG